MKILVALTFVVSALLSTLAVPAAATTYSTYSALVYGQVDLTFTADANGYYIWDTKLQITNTGSEAVDLYLGLNYIEVAAGPAQWSDAATAFVAGSQQVQPVVNYVLANYEDVNVGPTAAGYQPGGAFPLFGFGPIGAGQTVVGDWIFRTNSAIVYGDPLFLAADVPEPAMLGLFGLGAIGLGLSRRRKAA